MEKDMLVTLINSLPEGSYVQEIEFHNKLITVEYTDENGCSWIKDIKEIKV